MIDHMGDICLVNIAIWRMSLMKVDTHEVDGFDRRRVGPWFPLEATARPMREDGETFCALATFHL